MQQIKKLSSSQSQPKINTDRFLNIILSLIFIKINPKWINGNTPKDREYILYSCLK